MVQCFACRGPLRLVEKDLYRCYICGQLQEDRGGQLLPPTMRVYPKIDQVRRAALEELYESSSGSEGGGREEVPFDPEFLEFLKVIGDYGAPKTMDEFHKLGPGDQQFYLGAYKEYLKEERKRKRLENLKKG